MRGSEYAELRAFAAVAQQGSFTRAATFLGVSPSALSQTIRVLEERLGARLLNRTTRSVAPSETGLRLLGRVLPALTEIEQAVAEVVAGDGRPAGTLRINTSRLAATQVLAPLAARFLEACPGVTLEIAVDETLVDIVSGGFDAGVRLGEKLEKDMIAVPLGSSLRLTAVAAPAYCDRFGTPETPRDLVRHRCLNTRWPTLGSLYRWEFERGGEVLDVGVTGPLITNEPEVLLRAAIDGLGIAYMFEQQVSESIARGSLVHLLRDWSPRFPGFHLYYPSRHTSTPLRAFLDFISADARASAD